MIWIIIVISLILFSGVLIAELVSWRTQIDHINIQIQDILKEKTRKKVTISFLDKRLENLTETINEIIAQEDQSLCAIHRRENDLKENIACLSHDLRTPLTSIRGYLELIQNASDENRSMYMKALLGKVLRLEQLVDEFYQICLLEEDQIQLKAERIEINSFITEVLLDNYSLFAEKGITPTISLSDKDIFLNADKTALIRIFQNLINNAIRSSSGRIVIEVSEDSERVSVAVLNSMKENLKLDPSRLFERFYAGDQSRSYGNSGQGLYIVKKLLSRMGVETPKVKIEDGLFKIILTFEKQKN